MTPDVDALTRITAELLTERSPEKLRDSAFALYALFSRMSEAADGALDPDALCATRLASGLALDPDSAALCVRDVARTSKFLRGTELAIRAQRARAPGAPIEVLYAGCGPFATLAVPLMTRFDSSEVRFTLLDIHSHSIRSARHLVESLGFQGFVAEYVVADATTYVHSPGRPPHIVVTETMQRALRNEPQVAITHHLAPQLRAGGVLIPEEIHVDACVYRPSTEHSGVAGESEAVVETPSARVRLVVASLMRLDARSIPDFSPVTFTLPPPSVPEHRLMLRTIIRVFGSIVLDEYEADITCPYVGEDVDDLTFGSEVTLHYEPGEIPGFRVRTALLTDR